MAESKSEWNALYQKLRCTDSKDQSIQCVWIHSGVWAHGRCLALSRALLRRSASVQELRISSAELIQSILDDKTKHTSKLAATSTTTETKRGFATLLLYLETSTALKSVLLLDAYNQGVCPCKSEDLVDHAEFCATMSMMCSSLSRNHNLTSFTCHHALSADTLCNFLVNAHALKILSISVENFYEEDCRKIESGLFASRSIQHVHLDKSNQRSVTVLVVQLLEHPTIETMTLDRKSKWSGKLSIQVLFKHHVKRVTIRGAKSCQSNFRTFLEHIKLYTMVGELKFTCPFRYRVNIPALFADFLRNAVISIKSLIITDYTIRVESWLLLRDAMRLNTALINLDLIGCRLDAEAAIDLATCDFVQVTVWRLRLLALRQATIRHSIRRLTLKNLSWPFPTFLQILDLKS
jgi:hypothetical protein